MVEIGHVEANMNATNNVAVEYSVVDDKVMAIEKNMEVGDFDAMT